MKGTILEKIIEAKRARVDAAKKAFGNSRPERSERPYRFREIFSDRSTPHIIAEFKRASPSKGVINDTLTPNQSATAYRDGGASAISVLTEEDFFAGSLADLEAIRNAVDLPILRKDFIIDEFQIRESAAAGADAILLIVAALSVEELRRFSSLANELGLDALIEVHDRAELEVAAEIEAKLIGVNNRDLKTFEVSLDVARDLFGYSPKEAVLIAESGIRTREEIDELAGLGYAGFLIGETLMRSGEARNELRKLIGVRA